MAPAGKPDAAGLCGDGPAGGVSGEGFSGGRFSGFESFSGVESGSFESVDKANPLSKQDHSRPAGKCLRATRAGGCMGLGRYNISKCPQAIATKRHNIPKFAGIHNRHRQKIGVVTYCAAKGYKPDFLNRRAASRLASATAFFP
jgi:hypothetical protein